MLGIVLLNYKNEEEIIAYVREELSKITTPNKIVIVDNSCSCDSIETLEKAFDTKRVEQKVNHADSIFIIDSKANLGYAKGNNLGAEFLNEHFKLDYLLFSNSDIRFINSNVVEVLCNKLKEKPKVGAINPKITGLDSKCQSPMIDIPFYKLHILRYILYPFFRKITPILQNAIEGEYYRLMGCFLLTTRTSFFQSGMFDPETFLYGEELILAERMRRNGFVNYYYPYVEILHEHGKTISNSHSLKNQLKLMFKNEMYYYQQYIHISKGLLFCSKYSFIVYINIILPFLLMLKSCKRN
nr:hypothetical protein [uncultured Marinifilum sp.]